ncbi:LacI family DNA-binding transcriptional regulator [Sphingosinicella sp. BN140058]|uniref:LacI family DNA-binding transcriptional regulator n=1 Tax=Sphingosinicella sp. BN140058 TaxID=1892855 RepID=UPI0010113359|nr:LacI family DNA-binding transcriptional regulator [Sphingosinicella sp. BN140058]QAY77394.1 LacI family DNA-binding transcriptional regulator [Sphingosinicella sp. BN140058]
MAKSGRVERGATIVDVAAHAGVSAMTVSRVINGRSGIRPETRAAVERAIKALAYTPNTAARSLVRSAELRIGIIYSNPSAAFMSEFLTGLFEEASSSGARLVLLKGEGGRPPTAAALTRFAASGLSGVILAPPLGESRSVLGAVRKWGIPVAAVGAYDVEGATCVRIDDRAAACEMTRHLIDLGHRRLGFVLGNPDQAASAERMAGFYDAVRAVDGVSVTVAQGDFSYASGLVAGEQLLSGPEQPTAIFASNDDMAAAIVSVAHRRHLDVPAELTVAGFDDTSAAVTLWPPLTTVHQPVRRLAAEALSAVIAEALCGANAPSPRLLEHELIKRQSAAMLSVSFPS